MYSFHSRHWVLKLAAGCLAALCFYLVLSPVTLAGDDKTRARAERALREGAYTTAEQLYRELLNKDAHDNDARLGLSLTLLKQRRFQDAYDNVARVLLNDPLSSRAHALLGAVILASGDFRESVEEFRTSISLNDNEAVAVAGLAMVDFYENRLESAVRGLRRACMLDSNEPDYVFNLGQAAARSERYKESADAYERFLMIAPKTDGERRARIRGLIDFLRFLGKQNSLYIIGGANRTIVKFEATDSRPILTVRVNGEKTPLRFVLDTGSGMSVISEVTAERLGVKSVARGGVARAVGGGGRFEIVYGFLSVIDISDVRVENVPVYIRHFFDDKVPVDGYLGLSVISKFITSIDYGNRTFSLARSRGADARDVRRTAFGTDASGVNTSAAPPLPPVEIPLRTTSSGFLSGEVKLEGVQKPLNFIIDTGASVSVVAEKLAAGDELSSYAEVGRMRVFGAAGVTENVKTLLLPNVMLGNITQEKINAAVLDLEPVNETAGFRQSGILGANFLKSFRVTFDFQRGVIQLEPASQIKNPETPQSEVQ